MTTHQVLVRAKEYLLNNGWWQHSLGGAGGPACLRGALVEGAGCRERSAHRTVYQDANRVVGDAIRQSIPIWNDAPGRTFDEVIAALDAAILATAPPKPDESPFTALEDLPAEQYIDCLSTLALIPAEAIA